MKNLEAFLKKIGLTNESIKKLNSDEEVNIDEIYKSYQTQIRNAMSNDPEFIQPIRDEIRGTELSKVEHKIKKTFALEPNEIQGKKFDEIVALAFEKTMNKASSSSSEEIQNKLIELSKENKRLLEEVIPAKEAESKDFIKKYQLTAIQQAKLASKKLLVGMNVAIPAIEAKIKELKWNLDIDPDGQVQVKTSEGLNVLAKDGTKVMSYDDVLDYVLGQEQLNLVIQSNGSPDNQVARKQPVIENNSDKAKYSLPGLKKAQENAETMKTIRTFGQ